MTLNEFNNTEIKNEILKYFGKSEYNIIYINYEKEFGIKIIKEGKDLFEKNYDRKLKIEDFDDFYKIYIFNEEEMATIYKFSNENYRISTIKYKYDDKKNILNYDILKEREIYLELELDKNDPERTEEITKRKFKIKIQIITEKTENDDNNEENFKKETMKYVEFID